MTRDFIGLFSRKPITEQWVSSLMFMSLSLTKLNLIAYLAYRLSPENNEIYDSRLNPGRADAFNFALIL